jgi:tRNA pseudouridine13 synthase
MASAVSAAMKLKSTPDDFRVEEILAWPLLRRGAWSVYRVEKSGVATQEILDQLTAQLGGDRKKIAHAGLKDKYARAVQHLAVLGSAPRALSGPGWRGELAGFLDQPLGAESIGANRFELVIRDLDGAEAEALHAGLGHYAAQPFPNYYDDQRLAAARAGGFMARHILRRESEAALKLYLQPAAEDKASDRERRRGFMDAWGKFQKCSAAAATDEERAIFTPLSRDRQAFSAALNAIEQNRLFFQVTAYQAQLWNQIVAARIGLLPGSGVIATRLGELPLPASWTTELSDGILPLPGKGAVYPAPFTAAVEKIFAAEGIAAKQFKVDKITHAHFKPSPRRVAVRAGALRAGAIMKDEKNPGGLKLEMSAELPSGSYVTMLLKCAAAFGAAPR